MILLFMLGVANITSLNGIGIKIPSWQIAKSQLFSPNYIVFLSLLLR